MDESGRYTKLFQLGFSPRCTSTRRRWTWARPLARLRALDADPGREVTTRSSLYCALMSPLVGNRSNSIPRMRLTLNVRPVTRPAAFPKRRRCGPTPASAAGEYKKSQYPPFAIVNSPVTFTFVWLRASESIEARRRRSLKHPSTPANDR